jgi:Predicted metal-binding protein
MQYESLANGPLKLSNETGGIKFMARIAIISCGNVKNEFSCPAVGCFKAFNNRKGMFERYKDDQESQIVGFSTCAGCPTLYAVEKILNKVKPLVELSKADTVHFSSCMVNLCPFVQKYKSVIHATYPHVDVVMGTDESTSLETMKIMLKHLLADNSHGITEEFKRHMPSDENKKQETGENGSVSHSAK